jgi:hypothetical protein
MHAARSFFTPCEFNACLYLCGNGSDLIEAFDPITYVFTSLNTSLPENNKCCMFVEDGKLVIISEKYVTKWSLGQGFQLVKVATMRHKKWEVSCNMAPVVAAEQVYLSDRGVCYSLKSDGLEMRFVAR